MNVRIEESWRNALREEFAKGYFKKLTRFVRAEYATKKVYPPAKYIFRALDLCPLRKVKVVILGQDPYHGPGQANGLSFAVPEGVALPPSLQNIFKEIEDDLGHSIEKRGSLERWAKQGVLLLNATLTVRARQAGSHQGYGWEEFTDAIIQKLSHGRENLALLLWGNYAKRKGEIIDRTRHLVLESAHPSPFSAAYGFFGSRHFSQTNEYLRKNGKEPIAW